MHRRTKVLAATAALGAAAGVLPSGAAAADNHWRCAATPLSGSVLGVELPSDTVGSVTGACANGSILPAVQLPDPLASLASIEALQGITAVNEAGAFAGAGLAHVKVGKIPVQLPEIPVPDALKKIEVSVPGIPVPVATVDLTPAIEAIRSLPSKDLLDLGILGSTVSGSCQAGAPVITGQSKILSASILGLPVDASNTVDTAVNLIDTEHIALDTLDTSLAKITLLGGVVNVDTGTILAQLKPILASMPPLAIPPQLAHIKLTASQQSVEDGMLVQRALRAQVSLAGQSIADLSIGKAAVGGSACEMPAPQTALECTKRKIALIDVLPEADHVRLYGAADKSLAGKTVSILFNATGKVVAKVKVGPDGGFTTTAPMPAEGLRGTNLARYRATAGRERSLNLKLMRRMVVDSVRSHGRQVTLRGRVIKPFANTPQTITLKRRVTCQDWKVVKRFKPNRDGSFVVTVSKPKNMAATVYRAETFVKEQPRNPKLYPTYTLPRAVDL